MQLAAVLLARVIEFVEMSELNPKGTLFFPDIAEALVERFRFQGYPQKLEDFDEQKGVNFDSGTWDGINVAKLTVFWNGLLLDTQSSTEDSERVLNEALTWARDKFGLAYDPTKVKRKRHVSQIIFYSEAPMIGSGTAISQLCEEVGEHIESILGRAVSYAPTELAVDFDRQGQVPIVPFRIQRRAETPFSENKYYSESPFTTSLHLQILQRFENAILSRR